MANENELFDQRIHDAYERVELGEEAQHRILAHLVVAQLRTHVGDESGGAQGTDEVPEAPLEEGLGMASTVSPREAASAPRHVRPRHAAPVKTPSHAAAPFEIPAIVEPDDSIPEGGSTSNAEALQETTVAPRRTGPKHFKSATSAKGDASATGGGDVVTYVPEERRHRRRSRKALRWLPLAAAVVLALVVIQVSGVLNGSKGTNADKAVQNYAESNEAEGTSAQAEESAAQAVEPPVDAEGAKEVAPPADADESASDEAPAEERALTDVDMYPLVTLEDGTRYTALREGLYVEEVEASKVGEKVGPGTASPFDAPDEAAAGCVVYEIKDEDAYAVQYDGEETYWRCTLI